MSIEQLKETIASHVPCSVVKNFFIYTIGKVLTSAISIVSAPIMMVLLPTSDYGLLSIIHCVNNITICLMGLGLVQLLLSEYSICHSSTPQNFINTIICTYTLCMAPLMVLCLQFRTIIADFLFIPQDQQSMIFGILIICFFSFFNDAFYQVLQIHGQSKAVAILQVIIAGTMVLSNIVLIGYFKYNIQAAIWTQCASVLAVFFIACVMYIHQQCYTNLSLYGTMRSAPRFLRISLPLVPVSFAGLAFALCNRWMLAAFSGLEATGIFAIADAGGQLMYRLILQPIQGAYGPYIMNAYANNRENIHATEKTNHRIMSMIMLFLIIAITAGYALTKPFLYYIIPLRYSMAIDCALWVVIGYVFLIGSFFVSTFIQFRQKKWVFIIVLTLTLMINTALSLCLIPTLGIWGLAYIVTITYALHFLMLLWANKHELKKICREKQI